MSLCANTIICIRKYPDYLFQENAEVAVREMLKEIAMDAKVD